MNRSPTRHSDFRDLSAMLMLVVIVVTGWFELLNVGVSCLEHCSSKAAAEAPLPAPHPGMSTCEKGRCCGDVCTHGADCQCGKPPSSFVLFWSAPGCHPGGEVNSVLAPASLGFRFLTSEVSIVALSPEAPSFDLPTSDPARSSLLAAPPTPPPKRA